MRKKLLLICGLLSATVLMVGMFAYSWYNTSKTINKPKEPQQVAEAKILNLTLDKSFHGCLVGVTTDVWCNVTVKNTGTANISEAIVYVDLIAIGNESLVNYNGDRIYVPYRNVISDLHINETSQIIATGFTSIMDYGRVISHDFNATIIVNGTVLDSKTLY